MLERNMDGEMVLGGSGGRLWALEKGWLPDGRGESLNACRMAVVAALLRTACARARMTAYWTWRAAPSGSRMGCGAG